MSLYVAPLTYHTRTSRGVLIVVVYVAGLGAVAGLVGMTGVVWVEFVVVF